MRESIREGERGTNIKLVKNGLAINCVSTMVLRTLHL